MVMIYHLLMANIQLGIYAVFAFYVISGFLMTTVMHSVYGYSASGRFNFAFSRFLRLYPSYWFVALLSVLVIKIVGTDVATRFHNAMSIPSDFTSVGQNLAMVFYAWRPVSVTPNLVPPVWAITVELFFYACICIGVSKTFERTLIWFLVSLVYVFYSFYAELPWQDRYYPIAAASLPFSIGSMIYFLSKKAELVELVTRVRLLSFTCFALLILNCALWIYLGRLDLGILEELGFYLNLFLCALMTIGIACNNSVHPFSTRFDQRIGQYSYPIYLLHMPIGLIVYSFSGAKHTYLSQAGLVDFCFSLMLVFGTSFVLLRLVDSPIQKYRASLRRLKI